MANKAVVVNGEECMGCESCIEVCKEATNCAITVTENEDNCGCTPVVDEEKCIGCGECVEVCPVECFEIQDK